METEARSELALEMSRPNSVRFGSVSCSNGWLRVSSRFKPGKVSDTGIVTRGGLVEIMLRVTTFDFKVYAFCRRPCGRAGLNRIVNAEFVPAGADAFHQIDYLVPGLVELYGPDGGLALLALREVIAESLLRDLVNPPPPDAHPWTSFRETWQAHPEYGTVTVQGTRARLTQGRAFPPTPRIFDITLDAMF